MIPGRKLAIILAGAVLWTASALCQTSANISGTVRNSAGKPQTGATVEAFAAGPGALLAVHTALTDNRGRFAISSLFPGQYILRVSAPSFLPSVRDHVTVAQDAHLILNFTLSTIFRAGEMLPARRGPDSNDDDWKWTLRSSANRALLRVFDPALVQSTAEGRNPNDELSAQLAFMAGGGFDGLGGMPTVVTDFDIEQGLSAGALAFKGNVGYGGRDPDGILRVSFKPRSHGDGPEVPEIAFVVRRASVDSPRLPNSTINSFGVSFIESAKLMDLIDVRYGAQLENASVVGPQVYFEPFIDAAMNVGSDGRAFYRQRWPGASQDDVQPGPRLSLTSRGLAIERGRHQEAGYEHRWKHNHLAASFYRDSISNLALSGIGQMDSAGPDYADDILAGSDLESFTANIGRMHARGIRVRWERQLNSLLDASAHYGYGTVLDADLERYATVAVLRPSLRHQMRSAFGGDLTLKLPRKTQVESSYNYTVGDPLTPVDALESRNLSNAPYLNVRVRQPLPNFLPVHVEAVIDIRNLLAQGYRPILGSDGRTLYLVQESRCLRGGLVFKF